MPLEPAPDYEALKSKLALADRELEAMERDLNEKKARHSLLLQRCKELEDSLKEAGVDTTNLESWIKTESKAVFDEVERIKSELSKVII